MGGRRVIKPGRKGPAWVVLEQPVGAHQLRENVHRGVFRVFLGWQRPTAEAENGGRILPVKHSPGIGIPCPCPSNRLRRLRLSRRAHPLWSRRIHRLVRSIHRKNYTLLWHRTVAEVGASESLNVEGLNCRRGTETQRERFGVGGIRN